MAISSDFNPSAPNVTYQRMRQLLAESGGGLQAGVIGATDLKVAQRGAGANMSVDVPAGAAWVAITTGTRNGYAHVYNDATANVAVTASNATNPRIDSILLRYNDTVIPTGSGSTPTLEIATGTATAGATLDNRTGAATPTGDFLRLADILVPATSTSVTTANIRDRRPWARGVYYRSDRSGIGDITITSVHPTLTALDAGTNLSPRIECSGAPLRVILLGNGTHSSVDSNVFFHLVLDGTVLANIQQHRHNSAVGAIFPLPSWEIIPAAGSHIISPQASVSSGTLTIKNTANFNLVMVVQEIVRPTASNT